jgi:glycosidase
VRPRWRVIAVACIAAGALPLVVEACGGGGGGGGTGSGDASMPDGLAADAPSTESGDGGGDAAATPFAPREAVLYHVYVRSFADSDGDGNGDLPGLTSKLDYVASLGVDGVLLLPIFQDDQTVSGGYGTTDYHHVASDYGGDAAWDAFVQAAHAHGLKVLLDLSLTLVSDGHPWFQAAAASASAPERAHFELAGPPCPVIPNFQTLWFPFPDGVCYLSLYGPTFAALNYFDPGTLDAGIAVGTEWIGRGADGFRLDSAPSIAVVDPKNPTTGNPSSPTTHAFWSAFMTATKAAAPSSFAVAEVTATTGATLTPFYRDGIDMVFDYPIYYGLVDAWTSGTKTNLAAEISGTIAARPTGALGGAFLGNHDVPGTIVAPYGRVADMLGDGTTRLQSGALLLLSLPSTPFVYYGEEIGLRGAPPPQGGSNDAGLPYLWSRNPMQWDTSAGRGFTTGTPWVGFSTDPSNVAAQSGVGGTLLETYRGLLKVRRSSPALRRGSYREVATSSSAVLAFLREDPAERVLVLVQFGSQASSATIDLAQLGITQATVTDRIFGANLPAVTATNASAYPVSLPPYGGAWLLLQ